MVPAPWFDRNTVHISLLIRVVDATHVLVVRNDTWRCIQGFLCAISLPTLNSISSSWLTICCEKVYFLSCHVDAVTEFRWTTSNSPQLSFTSFSSEGSLSCASAWSQWRKYYPLTGPSWACTMKKNYQNKDDDCHLLSPWTVPWQPSLQAHVLVLDLASPCKLETGTQNGWPNPHESKL